MAKNNNGHNQAMEAIERAKASDSKQPRFTPDAKSTAQFFNQIYGWVKGTIFDEPRYVADSKKRDEWLAKVVLKEPYLLGILQSVVSIDKNRGWTLTGGRNQIAKFTNILHNFQTAPDLYGWRNSLSVTSQSWYQADLGAVVEIGRAQRNGPLAALYTVDPTKCTLTGKMDTPLQYTNAKKDKRDWEPNDYFRVVSLPNPAEAMNGLGYCAVSRCIELAKLLVGVFEHDRERLGSKAPKGILTINGLTQDQWLRSLEESTDERSVLEREYYSGVQVLAGDALAPVTVALTSLSNLPEQFDHRTFIDMLIYGYALAFGYDPREFWPVSSGALGTATETESQHRKATSKGGLDFALSFQEKIQEELPETVEFEFEQRDVEGDISEVKYKKEQLSIISQMFHGGGSQPGQSGGEPLINYDEARQLLVEANLIHEDWTTQEEDIITTDTDDEGEALDNERVRRAMEKFPEQDIVQYSYLTGITRTLRKAGQKKIFIRRGGPGSGRHPEGGSKDDDEGGSFKMMPDGGIEWVPAGGDVTSENTASSTGKTKMNEKADSLVSSMSENSQTVIRESGASEIRVVGKDDMDRAVEETGGKRNGVTVAGIHLEESNSILVLERDEGMDRTLVHEAAHAIDLPDENGIYAISESKEWLKASGWKKSTSGKYSLKEDKLYNAAVSEYARQSPWEDFAESFAQAINGSNFDRRVMQGESSKRYEFIKRLAKDKYGIELTP